MRYKGILSVELEMEESCDSGYLHPAEEYLSKLASGIWEKDEHNDNCVVGITYELEKPAGAATPDGPMD